ncbi:hypothetical protein CONPUDRAFT_162058 [Coniophora puteana RWD-64-598 SS2]|uniref:Uncharacterized protein n=1 Tax=Coniophora puteana (strain RWD-64-598) TaxID=741705 RepID=A0A5M3N123_CONPW|nr:uncharacterized protein CONPUDRAFT_162058 [Coniophora puteana RWD-64-598 SS2]EIW84704.1 hypothetical protein CONPUDRAFT_162058 [Coniophora puteana RWD-64-598 SS2]
MTWCFIHIIMGPSHRIGNGPSRHFRVVSLENGTVHALLWPSEQLGDKSIAIYL